MKFRKFLLNLRLWFRYRSLKRQNVKLRRQITTLESQFAGRLDALRAFYERRLEETRTLADCREDGWRDSFMQLQKLMPISHRALDYKERASANLPPEFQTPEKADSLSIDQQFYLEDYKQNFFEMGRNAGKSEAEVNNLWQTEYEEAAKEESRNAVISE